MTPEQKSKELIEKYRFVEIPNYSSVHEVKECALIAVNEILNTIYDEDIAGHLIDEIDAASYWEEVKKHIKKA